MTLLKQFVMLQTGLEQRRRRGEALAAMCCVAQASVASCQNGSRMTGRLR